MNTRTETRNASDTGKRRTLLLPALLAAILSTAMLVGLADAARGQRGRARAGGWGGKQTGMLRGLGLEVLNLAEEIDLSEEQIGRLKEIRKSAPGKIMPKTQALMEARMEYQDLMSDTNADTKALRQAHQRVLNAQSQVRAATFDLRLEVREVLTPEQRAEVQKRMQQRQRLRGPLRQRLRRDHWGFGPGGLHEHFGDLHEHFGDLHQHFGDLHEHFDLHEELGLGLGPGFGQNGPHPGWLEQELEIIEDGGKM